MAAPCSSKRIPESFHIDVGSCHATGAAAWAHLYSLLCCATATATAVVCLALLSARRMLFSGVVESYTHSHPARPWTVGCHLCSPTHAACCTRGATMCCGGGEPLHVLGKSERLAPFRPSFLQGRRSATFDRGRIFLPPPPSPSFSFHAANCLCTDRDREAETQADTHTGRESEGAPTSSCQNQQHTCFRIYALCRARAVLDSTTWATARFRLHSMYTDCSPWGPVILKQATTTNSLL